MAKQQLPDDLLCTIFNLANNTQDYKTWLRLSKYTSKVVCDRVNPPCNDELNICLRFINFNRYELFVLIFKNLKYPTELFKYNGKWMNLLCYSARKKQRPFSEYLLKTKIVWTKCVTDSIFVINGWIDLIKVRLSTPGVVINAKAIVQLFEDPNVILDTDFVRMILNAMTINFDDFYKKSNDHPINKIIRSVIKNTPATKISEIYELVFEKINPSSSNNLAIRCAASYINIPAIQWFLQHEIMLNMEECKLILLELPTIEAFSLTSSYLTTEQKEYIINEALVSAVTKNNVTKTKSLLDYKVVGKETICRLIESNVRNAAFNLLKEHPQYNEITIDDGHNKYIHTGNRFVHWKIKYYNTVTRRHYWIKALNKSRYVCDHCST